MSSHVVVPHLPEAAIRLADVLLRAIRLTVTLYDAAVQRAILMILGRLNTSDLIQDVYGARSLLDHHNLYPPIGVAAARLGVNWAVTGRSTHPPTGISVSRAHGALAVANCFLDLGHPHDGSDACYRLGVSSHVV